MITDRTVVLTRVLRPILTKMLMDWDHYLVLELLRYQCKSWRCSLLHENQVYQWLGSYPNLRRNLNLRKHRLRARLQRPYLTVEYSLWQYQHLLSLSSSYDICKSKYSATISYKSLLFGILMVLSGRQTSEQGLRNQHFLSLATGSAGSDPLTPSLNITTIIAVTGF